MAFVELFGVLMPFESAVLLVGESIIAVLFIVAVVLAALHKGTYHHYLVLSGFLLDELVFKPLMYQRLSLGVLGSFPYEATAGLPHIALSSVATVLGIVTIYLGFRYRTKKGWRMFMPPKGRIHRYIGASYLIAWAVTMVIGLRIFATFYL
jgi:hypothetical protein